MIYLSTMQETEEDTQSEVSTAPTIVASGRSVIQAAGELLSKAKKVLVSGHLSPDGDSYGAMTAVARMLRAAGVDAIATADVKSLGKMAFMQGAEEIVPLKRIRRKRFDLLFVVDCASLDRLPPEVRPFAQKLPAILIDHHKTNTAFAQVSIIEPEAASACQIVWKFAKAMGWKLDAVTAESLWVGMITDSGRFAYETTTPETLMAAADILRYGVDTARINDIIFCSFNARAIKLKRLLWRSLHIWKNRKVAEVSLSRDDFRQVRGTKADAEDGIEIPRSIMRNEIALFFYQIPDRTKETRVSIRTREPWDATLLAARFGGGGHLRAAGCTINGTMNEAKRQMRKAVREMFAAGRPRKDAPTEPPPAEEKTAE